jgi:sugar lactone lactonase YvrE
MTPRLLFEAGMQTGEGPVWDDRQQRLLCVDSTNPAVWVFDSGGRPLDRIALPQAAGFVCLTEAPDTVLVGLEDGIHALHLTDRGLRKILDPEPDRPDNRINDATVDIDGSLVFGTLHAAYREPTGALYRLAPDGSLTCFDRGYIVSNGPCAHPDGRFLAANSEFHEVYAFDRLPGRGFGNRRPFCSWDKAWGIPDGMVCDVDGGVWVGCWDGGALIRLDAAGRMTDRIRLPVSRVTKAAFGGSDLGTLYITTANRGIPASREPLAGSVFAVEARVPGMAARRVPGSILEP